jgi:hypothetical protein
MMQKSLPQLRKQELEGIEDGDKSAEADSMSSENQKSCREAGATLSRKKAT